jgi:hypothetical protein
MSLRQPREAKSRCAFSSFGNARSADATLSPRPSAQSVTTRQLSSSRPKLVQARVADALRVQVQIEAERELVGVHSPE